MRAKIVVVLVLLSLVTIPVLADPPASSGILPRQEDVPGFCEHGAVVGREGTLVYRGPGTYYGTWGTLPAGAVGIVDTDGDWYRISYDYEMWVPGYAVVSHSGCNIPPEYGFGYPHPVSLPAPLQGAEWKRIWELLPENYWQEGMPISFRVSVAGEDGETIMEYSGGFSPNSLVPVPSSVRGYVVRITAAVNFPPPGEARVYWTNQVEWAVLDPEAGWINLPLESQDRLSLAGEDQDWTDGVYWWRW
ncbi:SH3 domain-containing protein [Patescibacteria group bacterium]|nr:SH3 domain-containing protein [Patescibacteria group bacterium]